MAIDSTESLRDAVLDAKAHGEALRIVGSGTWLDAGASVRATRTLCTRELAGIVDYVPGDLTLTARAGTTLSEIRRATAEHNQWLALDPGGSDDSTLGAVAATASAGPLATAFGTPRDLVLGVEFVSGDGRIVRGGGKVVKNVAGFDLTRLLVGSWGTLGVITEVSVRLHARPEVDRTIAIRSRGADAEFVARVRTELRRLPFIPFACEVVNATLAREVVGDATTTAIFRLAGNADAVAYQSAALADLGASRETDPAAWGKLRSVDTERGSHVLRMSNLPSSISATWKEAAILEGAMLQASPARGVVRVIAPETVDPTHLGRMLQQCTATWIGERLPAVLWQVRRAPLDLHRRVRAAFDPLQILNPGILGDLT